MARWRRDRNTGRLGALPLSSPRCCRLSLTFRTWSRGRLAGHDPISCFIEMKIAERFQISEGERSALFYALLPKEVGCSSNSSKVAGLFESDDFRAKELLKTANWSAGCPGRSAN